MGWGTSGAYLSAKDGTYEGASVRCREAVYECTPDIEILTGSAPGIRGSGVAERSASFDIVPVDKREAHVLVTPSSLAMVGEHDCQLTPGALLAPFVGPKTG